MKKTLFFSYLFLIFILFSSCIPQQEETTTTTMTPKELSFSPIGGMYKNSVEVSINYTNADAIYYTTDNSTPTTNSTKYTSPITLTSSTLIRTMGVKGSTIKYAMSYFDIDSSTNDITSHYQSPSNQWKDEVIYLAMIDRFADGDTTNNNQGYDEYGTTTEAKYSGGDFKGLTNKLDYIKSLGVTTIWITPPIKNEWWLGGTSNYGGYHGYWASDFKNVDPHFGTIQDYKDFVDAAHSKGLRVIQDIVVNHVGDYFTCTTKLTSPTDTSFSLITNPNPKPSTAPEQMPWKLNNPSIFTQDEFDNNSFYHWTPNITDYSDITKYYDNQMSGLDDINTDNPVVANLMRGYFRYWIDKVGIDGYRVDTVLYVKPEFFEDFTNSTETNNKGIREYAKEKGKSDFIMFGETYNQSDAVNASYTKSADGKNRLDSIIYFPLRYSIIKVFAEGKNTSELTTSLNKRYTAGYANPDKLVTFIDNHDVARFLSLSTDNMTKSAYAFIMTIPGIPKIYYGSEQGLKEMRGSLFNGGFAGENKTNSSDLYDTNTSWYIFLKDIISLRKNNSVFRNGTLKILKDNSNSSGIFSYKMVEGTGGVDKEAIVFFNTSGSDLLIADMTTDGEKGDKFDLLQPSLGTQTTSFTLKDGGIISINIPKQSYGIFLLKQKSQTPPTPITNTITITSPTKDASIDTNDITVSGTIDSALSTGQTIKVFIDGNIDSSATATVTLTSWTANVSLETTSNGYHKIYAMIDTGNIETSVISQPTIFEFTKPFVEAITITDPESDDKGPAGFNYTLPTDISFATHLQDILKVKVSTSGGSFKVELTMKDVSSVWNPSNGFDHVVPSIFIQKKDSTSTIDINPKHNYTIPNSFKWDYLFMGAGWNFSMYEKTGATTSEYGTAVTTLPICKVDKTNKTLTFTFSSSSIGNPTNLSGWKIYISTWDEDNGTPRRLKTTATAYEFGGGDGTKDPLVIDETDIITIP
ncbi:MAG: hypothetical protein A2Y34_12440 [Spirochaetes bacterium GWC1_27_15]|nr:MAG: hypothetical protein A2Z98_05470 [Spirochaetes bacterium GWB1_27_13]OHD21775.1 MAG: hypothetical protein A2Y34_12440 [Spirochaetes bacterium GWC1_27_15]